MKSLTHLHLFGIAIIGASLVAGCASAPQRPGPASRPSANPVVVIPRNEYPGQASGVIGRTAGALTAMFGQPALDVREGIARKLQFLNGACVLDAYLYPARDHGEAVVSHVDTRTGDGRDTDRAACVQALRRR